MFIPESLYKEISKIMPIPCVDLLVTDREEKVLLVKRKNEPAEGQWWFPGGRVYYGESRQAAAIRKLKEECGLVANDFAEMGTYDVMLNLQKMKGMSHGITTLFSMKVLDTSPFILDSQSLEADWRSSKEWLREKLHFFIRSHLKKPQQNNGTGKLTYR